MSRELQRIAPPPQTDGSTLYPCGCNADRVEGSTCGHCGREILGVEHRQTLRVSFTKLFDPNSFE